MSLPKYNTDQHQIFSKEEFLKKNQKGAHPNEDQPEENEFDLMDTNKDGKLSKEEAVEYLSQVDPDNMPDVDQIWEEADTDKDGFVT